MQHVISTLIAIGYLFFSSPAPSAGMFSSSFGFPDLLSPKKAFVVSQPSQDIIQITIAKGTYLYDQRILVQNNAGKLLTTNRSEPVMYDDILLGPTPIHRKILRISVADAPKKIVLTYQGCADIGFCYPPQQTELSFSR